MAKSNGSLGSNVVVTNGTDLGAINFAGNDGASFLNAASIRAEVDGTPGSNDMPGRLVFFTTADGASAPTERLRISANGRVGIGTSSPENLLQVGDATTVNSNSVITFGKRVSATQTSAPLIGQTSDNGNSNDLGICATSSSGSIIFYTGNGQAGFGDGTNAERMRINRDGDILIGQNTESRPGNSNTTRGAAFEYTSNGAKLYLSQNSGTALNVNRNNDGTVIDLRRSGTQVGRIQVTSSATSYLTTSDYRLKENVVVLDGAIGRVKQLLPKRFNFVQTPNETVDGFIAHEAQAVVPESVSGVQDAMKDEEYEVTPAVIGEDGEVTEEAVMGIHSVPDYQGIDQAKLVPLLTAALQEAITKIETLETKVAALEAG